MMLDISIKIRSVLSLPGKDRSMWMRPESGWSHFSVNVTPLDLAQIFSLLSDEKPCSLSLDTIRSPSGEDQFSLVLSFQDLKFILPSTPPTFSD